MHQKLFDMKYSGTLLAAVSAVSILSVSTASAADFFSTERSEELFSVGARIGFNTSNTTTNGDGMSKHQTSWGTGFDLGVVANINFRDWFAVQPGFFYESRSNGYTFVSKASGATAVMVGDALEYAFKVPVLAQARFNVSDKIRWSVDLGPYFSFGIGHKDKGTLYMGGLETDYSMDYDELHKKFDFGFKVGSGITVLDHYYLGIHYMAGMSDAYKNGGGGSHKAWTFTLGYDF